MRNICYTALLFSLTFFNQSIASDLEKVARGITVKIVVMGLTTTPFGNTKKEITEGTGFILTSDGYIVTNKHVVFPELIKYESDPDVMVYLPDSNGLIGNTAPVKASIVNQDEKHDFLLLKVDGRFDAASCEFVTPAIGDEIYIFGYSGGSKGEYISGSGPIEPSSSVSGDTGKLAARIKSTYGNSGSPIFSVDSNKLIGFVLQNTQIPKESVFDLTLFHRILQVRDLLPSTSTCKFGTNSCLSVEEIKRHTQIQAVNGLIENCPGNAFVDTNRAKVTVGSLENTQCYHSLRAAVSVNAPQYPLGKKIPTIVTTTFKGNNGAFQWNFRPRDSKHLDKIHPNEKDIQQLSQNDYKGQTIEGFLRNGKIYEFELVAGVQPESDSRASSAEFEIELSCD